MEKSKKKGCITAIIVAIAIIIGIVLVYILLSYIISQKENTDTPNLLQADMSNISGNWTQGLFQNTYTFIPSCNIKGLVLRFEIYDSNYKIQNTIDKNIGDVKKGQQYTVTISIDEYWTGSQVKTTVLRGKKSLF